MFDWLTGRSNEECVQPLTIARAPLPPDDVERYAAALTPLHSLLAFSRHYLYKVQNRHYRLRLIEAMNDIIKECLEPLVEICPGRWPTVEHLDEESRFRMHEQFLRQDLDDMGIALPYPCPMGDCIG